jgi:hypothetical protein
MYRCVPGSAYYAPYNCNPGEIGYVSPVTQPAPDDTGTTTTTTTPAPTPTTTTTTPAPPPAVNLTAFAKLVVALQKKDLATKGTATKVTKRSVRFGVRDTFVGPGKVTYGLYLTQGRKVIRLGAVKKTITKKGKATTTIPLSKLARRYLVKYPKADLYLKTTFVFKATGAKVTTTRLAQKRP